MSAVRVARPDLPPAVEVSARRGYVQALRDLVAFRGLLWTLTVREVKVRYHQTALGVAWAIAQPLVLTLVFSVFFGQFAKISSDGMPYPLFSYAALLPWTFFATALAFGIPSLVMNSTLVTKVYFPREALPLAAVLSAFVDFFAGAIVFVLLMSIYGVSPTTQFFWLPVLLIVQLIFTVAITLSLSALNVSYRDVRYALPLVIQVWLYLTPVIYPLSSIPHRYRTLYLTLNPMAGVIDSFRRVLVQGLPPRFGGLGLSAAVSCVLLVASYVAFKRAERRFADVI